MDEFIKKRRRNIILIILGIIVGLIIVGVVLFFNDNSKELNDSKVDIVEDETDNETIEEDLSFYINSKRTEKITTLNERVKLYAEEINSGTDEVVISGYDGYYIAEDENVSYLKRNQKIVAKLEKKNTFVIYKDETDKDSKYIAVVYTKDSGFDLGWLETDSIANLLSYDEKNERAMSIIYNINTGKCKVFKNDSYVTLVAMNDGEHFVLEEDKYYFINPNTFQLIDTADYVIVGDTNRMAQGDEVVSYSSKYVVVTKDDKYGLIDYNGKVVIDSIYDDLITISDDLLIAGKNNKYGVIKAAGGSITEIKYDFLYAYDGYYVVKEKDKIGVLDSKGNVLVPLNITVDDVEEFNLRFSNRVYITKSLDNIVIDYTNLFDNEDEIRKYIIISSDGKYELKEGDYYGLYYNFSNEHFYALKDDNKINFYNSKNEILGNMECSSSYGFKFYDNKTILFTCMDGKSDVKYFDIVSKKEVSENDLNKEYSDFDTELGNLSIYHISSKKVIVDYFSGELIFRLDEKDNISLICDDYYKIVYSDGRVEYYLVKY